jgi:anti-anti-sigma regulatory factor
MVFKITRERDDSGVRLHIDCDLNHEALSELAGACEKTEGPLTIDLSGLSSSDSSILKALHQLAHAGVKLEGASPYLSIQLSDMDEVCLKNIKIIKEDDE